MSNKVSTLQTQPSTNKSGSGMDSKIEKTALPWKRYGMYVGSVSVLVFAVALLLDLGNHKTFSVESSRLVVSTVEKGFFEDFIPVRGRVTPRNTIYLDAMEGGRVERVLLEDGTTVKAGDLIAELSNTGLQLDVTRNKALVTEQLNNMRSMELRLEQNRLAHKRNLVEIDYQIVKLEKQLRREQQLRKDGAIAETQIDDTRDELEYFRNRREVTLESQATDARLQEQQMAFLETTSTQLEESLEIARRNLDSLNVRAPVDGKLSGFDIEVGQSIARGGRIGQIDSPQDFKLNASIDEFYLGRVDIGQTASFQHNGREHNLVINKIYPQISGGSFDVDFVFEDGDTPANIRRGQTLQTKLTLGDPSEAILIPNGAFYQDTGGQWIFVVGPDGEEAVKRNIKTGRRNTRYIEVLDGLEQGERVVTSPYSSFRDIDRLQLNGAAS